MQMDMHYHGVYSLARLAGLARGRAWLIATASQYVDDSVNDQTVTCATGSRLIPGDRMMPEVTCHHLSDLVQNTNPDDQRRVWVPFHFLPAGRGEAYTERLVCGRDSRLARRMLDHCLSLTHRPFALELAGIAAHVYADTFAHYGFAGVSSRRNRIVGSTLAPVVGSQDLVEAEKDGFFERYGFQGGLLTNIRDWATSSGAELASGALGHGAAATFPDKPFLKWSFSYEHPEIIGGRAVDDCQRDNPADYLEACEKLWSFLVTLGRVRSEWTGNGPRVDFADVADQVAAILSLEADTDQRCQAWREAMGSGRLTGQAEEIPEYLGRAWDGQRRGFPGYDKPTKPDDVPVYRFYQAASYHRHYVLRELLPAAGVMVV